METSAKCLRAELNEALEGVKARGVRVVEGRGEGEE